jgi:hypothetical protein
MPHSDHSQFSKFETSLVLVLLFAGTVALLVLFLTGDFAAGRLNLLFLLLIALASLFLTIALLTLLSGESVAQLKARFGSVTVDLAGTVGVFFCCAAALYFGYGAMQEKWWSDLGVPPEQLRNVIDEHEYIVEQLGENKHLLSEIGRIASRYSQQELLRNRLSGQYCYYFKDPSEDAEHRDKWQLGRLSIEARQEEPLLLLAGKTRTVKFHSLRIAVHQNKLIYDWTAEDVGSLRDARAAGIGTLDIVYQGSPEQGQTIKEMTGWYLVFGRTYGRLLLLPLDATSLKLQGDRPYQEGNLCIELADSNGLSIAKPEDT